MSIDYSLFPFPKPKNKAKKSKRTKATDIDIEVKKIVLERDKHKCIFCGKVVPLSSANAHFIKRSQGGMGIKENIVTLCSKCHYEEDHGLNTQLYEKYIENYLKGIYGTNWNKEKLIYNKWEDYHGR